jgi:hypothetical protein
MTDERMTIIRGIFNCIKVYNKVWKIKASDSDLLIHFGTDENLTIEEVNEFLALETAA